MNVLYMRHAIGWRPPLSPDERVVHTEEGLRKVTFSCGFWSTFWSNSFPPGKIRIWITGRRVLLTCHFVPFLRQEVGLCFSEAAPQDKADVITAVSCKEVRGRRCLEIRSRNAKRRTTLLSHPELTTRVYGGDPGELERIVRETMSQ